ALQISCFCRQFVAEPVVNPDATLLGLNEAGLFQLRHVVRDRWLRQAEASREIADADGRRRLPKRSHHRQARRVAESLHQLGSTVGPGQIDPRYVAANPPLPDPLPGRGEGSASRSHDNHVTLSIDDHRWIRRAEDMSEIKDAVRSRYADAARKIAVLPLDSTAGCCGVDGPDCGCAGSYATEDLKEIGLSDAVSLGCGNPTMLADLKPGEVVLDLGSGAGLDVLLSARRVSPGGQAYGVDMTDEMLE